MNPFYRPLEELRTYFIMKRDPEGAEACNNMMAALDKNPRIFVISRREAEELMKFFLTCGYISREFHQPVHELIDRLSEFTSNAKLS